MRSPLIRETDPERRRVTVTVEGPLTDADIREFVAQYPPGPTVEATRDYDRLVDITGLEGDLTLALVRSVAEALRAARDGFVGRYAIVAPTDEGYGMMQTLVRLAFTDMQRARVFRSRGGAEAWLSLPWR